MNHNNSPLNSTVTWIIYSFEEFGNSIQLNDFIIIHPDDTSIKFESYIPFTPSSVQISYVVPEISDQTTWKRFLPVNYANFFHGIHMIFPENDQNGIFYEMAQQSTYIMQYEN